MQLVDNDSQLAADACTRLPAHPLKQTDVRAYAAGLCRMRDPATPWHAPLDPRNGSQ